MKVLIFIMMTLVLPVRAYADEIENSFSLSCTPTTVNPGDNISCTLKIKTNAKKLHGITTYIDLEDGLEVEEFTVDSALGGSFPGYNKDTGMLSFLLSNEELNAGDYKLGELKLKVKDDATAVESRVTFYRSEILYLSDDNEDDVKVNVAEVKSNITIKEKSQGSVVTGLSSIEIKGGKLAPEFAEDKFDYIAYIEGTEFGIEFEKNNSEDEVESYYLSTKEGNNVEEIKLTDFNNITFHGGDQALMLIVIKVGSVEYNLTVIRNESEEEKKLDNSLSSLVVDGEDVLSECENGTCEVTVRDLTKYEYKAVLKDSENFKFGGFTPEDGAGTNGGDLVITILPKDDSSSIENRVYTIHVKASSSSSSKPVASSDITSNPGTSGISKFYITLIMIASLIMGLTIYKKNIDTYE